MLQQTDTDTAYDCLYCMYIYIYVCVNSPVQVWHNLWLSEMENGWIPEQVQDSILPLQFI